MPGLPLTLPYTLPGGSSSVAIEDTAFNPLVTPATATMLGYTEPEAEDEALQLRIYMFLIEGIRLADATDEGNLFLKRFLEGPQTVWDTNQAHIFALKDLWDINNVPDRFLQYLKRILGWTPDLDNITSALDYDTLRRLIAASAQLWKDRGSEDALGDVLQLTTSARNRIMGWFDWRWVTDETGLGHEHEGRDPWVVGEADQQVFNVRIVDNGSLNRALVRNLCKLMRPMGERIEINYLLALDLFQTDGDNSQWITEDAAAPLDVLDGVASLEGATDALGAVLAVDGVETWDNYIFTARVKGVFGAGGFDVWGVTFLYTDDENHYAVYATTSGWALVSIVGGTLNILADVGSGGSPHTTATPSDMWVSVRVQVVPEAGDTRIVVYIDGTEVFNVLDSTFSLGPPGIIRLTKDADVTLDEIEVMGLPAESDTIDINS
jgi:phage tail-like protein